MTLILVAALGLKPGVPDILIFDPPPAVANAKGVAIELKRAKGGRTSKAQQEWLEELGGRGWVCSVCEGICVAPVPRWLFDELSAQGVVLQDDRLTGDTYESDECESFEEDEA